MNEENKIIGGQTAEAIIPWQVSVRLNGETGAHHYCGGVVLDEKTVLSAKHCFVGRAPADFHVMAGILNKKNDWTNSIGVEKILYANTTNQRTFENDLAILKLKEALAFQANKTERACLPPSSKPFLEIDFQLCTHGVGCQCPGTSNFY